MGGTGSGRWGHKPKREYLDECISMDINYLNRHRALVPGAEFALNWGDDDSIVDSLRITVEDTYLDILYQEKTERGLGDLSEGIVELTYTRCNYGSRRPWFVCPSCASRAGKLFHLEAGFICRKCSKLPYQSQSESKRDRSIHKARKLRLKLGADENLLIPVFLPPEGMYWKTFNRLNHELEQVEQVIFG